MKETEIYINIEDMDAKAKKAEETGEQQEDQISIEQAFVRLEQILTRLEAGETSLEQSFELYRQGMKLAELCGRKIDRIEKQLVIIGESEDADEF